jgi:kynurenine formamidase
MVLQQQRIVLENLANLHFLPAADFTLAIGILRLLGGSGSPVSVLAFVA